MACQTRKVERGIVFLPHQVQGKMIVTFRDTTLRKEMEHRFRRQNLRASDCMAEQLDIWLFRYDSTRISPQRMAAKLLVKGFVSHVEFDVRTPSLD